MVRRLALASLLLLTLALPARADLAADELVLIVNRREPAGRELADYYAAARNVPEGRIVELDLPTADTLDRTLFERQALPAVRRFLDENELTDRVRCAVTFYGVPLAVGAGPLSDDERRERLNIENQADALAGRLLPIVARAEDALIPLGYERPAVPGAVGHTLQSAMDRLAAAQEFVRTRAPTLTPEQGRQLSADLAAVQREIAAPFAPEGERVPPDELRRLFGEANDPAGRERLRQAVRAGATLGDYAAILLQQARLLDDAQSDASFDSELATIFLDAAPRANWLVNPLARDDRDAAGSPRVLMVSRLDGRDPQQVRDMIADGLATERDGLAGKVVIDSRGLPDAGAGGDAYAFFDTGLRSLANLLRDKAALEVVHDDESDVIRAPAKTVDDVAVYVGWYNLKSYVPGLTFARGAVGYHVASFEMLTLREPTNLGWVRGLLDDRVVATLGPTGEPYLSSFPPPGRFVPLLLTGELTMAEVYWRTTPMLSWKIGLIGDPLYRPFKAKPAMSVADLPAEVRGLLDSASE